MEEMLIEPSHFKRDRSSDLNSTLSSRARIGNVGAAGEPSAAGVGAGSHRVSVQLVCSTLLLAHSIIHPFD